jgi:hypothetical protein
MDPTWMACTQTHMDTAGLPPVFPQVPGWRCTSQDMTPIRIQFRSPSEQAAAQHALRDCECQAWYDLMNH